MSRSANQFLCERTLVYRLEGFRERGLVCGLKLKFIVVPIEESF